MRSAVGIAFLPRIAGARQGKVGEDVKFGPASGEGKSVLETVLRFQGIPFVTGPVYTDGPEDFAQAERDAHDIEKCLPRLHDTVLEATGQSLDDERLHAK